MFNLLRKQRSKAFHSFFFKKNQNQNNKKLHPNKTKNKTKPKPKPTKQKNPCISQVLVKKKAMVIEAVVFSIKCSTVFLKRSEYSHKYKWNSIEWRTLVCIDLIITECCAAEYGALISVIFLGFALKRAKALLALILSVWVFVPSNTMLFSPAGLLSLQYLNGNI